MWTIGRMETGPLSCCFWYETPLTAAIVTEPRPSVNNLYTVREAGKSIAKQGRVNRLIRIERDTSDGVGRSTRGTAEKSRFTASTRRFCLTWVLLQ